jgi:hypothetical protein
MNAEHVFLIANLTALAGWLVLIFMGRHRWVQALVTGAVVPLLLSVVYTALVLTHWGETKGGFGSLAAVQALFSNEWMLLAGWVHYLAFDLFIGSWEVRNANRHRISQWLVIPCLVLTFLFGPAGLLLYGAVRTFALRGLTLSELSTNG